MTEVIEDYRNRAANTSKPFQPLDSVRRAFAALLPPDKLGGLSATHSFWADISEFQNVVDKSYPYPIIALRGDTGGRTDYHFAANWRFCKASADIEVVIVYLVYIPGQNSAIVSRLKSVLGPKCPDKVVFMIDMESGDGFAGSGNHSAEANRLAESLAAYAGSNKRVVGYANSYDWANNWPTRPNWLKRVTASYGVYNPGTWAWQYYGGLKYDTQNGFPRNCKPFGSWVDMNVSYRTLSQIKDDLGLTPLAQPDLLEWIMSLSGAPKGLTYDQFLTDLATKVWHVDVVPSPPDPKTGKVDPKNPTWTPGTYLRVIYNHVKGLK